MYSVGDYGTEQIYIDVDKSVYVYYSSPAEDGDNTR